MPEKGKFPENCRSRFFCARREEITGAKWVPLVKLAMYGITTLLQRLI